MKRLLIAATALTLFAVSSCKNGTDTPAGQPAGVTADLPVKKTEVPAFNADSAYDHIAVQVGFGPRTPGSAAQKKCADWMQGKLRATCDTVYRQETVVTGWDGKKLPCINLIGSIHPKATRRVLLLTHWDSRPWADNDVVNKDQPILAADDGGSGVGVLIELSRILKEHPLPEDFGVDILFTDVEDYGKSSRNQAEEEKLKDSYCLGTQYWARNPHVPGYKADYGILLDMVGGRDSRFLMEGSSTDYAGSVQRNIWETANRAGYSSFFPFIAGGRVTDDHVYVNELAHIPTIDIISLRDDNNTGFPNHWHTHNDNMSVIDKRTLKAVGQTLLQTLYEAAQPA